MGFYTQNLVQGNLGHQWVANIDEFGKERGEARSARFDVWQPSLQQDRLDQCDDASYQR